MDHPPIILPDIEADSDLGSFTPGNPVLQGGNFEQIEPGSPEWDEAEAAVSEPPQEEDSFPDEIDQDLRGLMFLGALEKKFGLLGHDFVMKTIKAGTELACTNIIKEFEGTLGQTKAFAIAFVAASVVSVDGIKMIEPIGPEQTLDVMRQRFQYVTENWFWPVIEALYEEYSELVVRQAAVFRALEGKLQAGRRTSSS